MKYLLVLACLAAVAFAAEVHYYNPHGVALIGDPSHYTWRHQQQHIGERFRRSPGWDVGTHGGPGGWNAGGSVSTHVGDGGKLSGNAGVSGGWNGGPVHPSVGGGYDNGGFHAGLSVDNRGNVNSGISYHHDF